MKEDILEQLVESYYQSLGYFTITNIKYKPREVDYPQDQKNLYSNHSDIDVLAFNPTVDQTEPSRVIAINCKSFQSGMQFSSEIEKILNGKKAYGREAWKPFRELTNSIWANAFRMEIAERTKSSIFTHVTAVTLVKKSSEFDEAAQIDKWINFDLFSNNLHGIPRKVLQVAYIFDYFHSNYTSTVASSQVGRLLQLIKASGWSRVEN